MALILVVMEDELLHWGKVLDDQLHSVLILVVMEDGFLLMIIIIIDGQTVRTPREHYLTFRERKSVSLRGQSYYKNVKERWVGGDFFVRKRWSICSA